MNILLNKLFIKLDYDNDKDNSISIKYIIIKILVSKLFIKNIFYKTSTLCSLLAYLLYSE